MVVTAHAEGLLLHRTLRSVQRAADEVRKKGVSVEVLVVLDRPTDATRGYLDQCGLVDRIEEIDAGDVAEGRNHGMRCAHGRYVTVIDGDDLVSVNWFTAGMAFLGAASPTTIAHPEYTIRFGDRSVVWRKQAQEDPDFHLDSVLWSNPWDVTCLALRALFIEHPYLPAQAFRGWGYEDHHWHCETIAAGCRHAVVPETVLFVRGKAHGSRWQEHVASRCVVRPSRFFDPGFLYPRVAVADTHAKAERTQCCSAAKILKAPLRVFTRTSLGSRIVRRLRNYWARQAEAMGILFAPVRPPLRLDQLPPAILLEWRAMNGLEPAVFPDSAASAVRGARLPWHARATQCYLRLARDCGERADYLFIVPGLVCGDSDLVVLNYVRALTRLKPSSRVVVIATENQESPWKDRLPHGVSFVDFGCRDLDLSMEIRAKILLRMLLQIAPERIHVVNSRLGYDLLIRHGQALKQISQLYASVYPEVLPDGRRAGYAFEQLPECFDHLHAVSADSQTFIDQLGRQFGFDPTRFHTHYQPIVAPTDRNEDRTRSDILRVLWAGRLDRQKRVDLLAEIAHRCRDLPMHFHVHGATLLAADPAAKRLRNARNVTLHGPYDGFASLPLQDYDVFLYTSQSDGIPNVLLEAMAAGLPAIASNVGGVGEVVRNNETGWLVTPFDDVSRYVSCLQELHRNRDTAKHLVAAASALLASRHSKAAFDQCLLTFPGYVHLAGQTVAE